MDIQHFQSGSFREEFQYRTFRPSLINHAWTLNDAELGTLLSQADRKLGELNAFSQLVLDVDFFIRMHVNKEATTSSRIEGTQTNIEDLIRLGILQETTGFKRNRIFAFQRYIAMFVNQLGYKYLGDHRFISLMDRFMPHWRHYRRELNRAPLAYERWEY